MLVYRIIERKLLLSHCISIENLRILQGANEPNIKDEKLLQKIVKTH